MSESSAHLYKKNQVDGTYIKGDKGTDVLIEEASAPLLHGLVMVVVFVHSAKTNMQLGSYTAIVT